MNILVTGCNGQLGNEIQLLAKNCTKHKFIFTDINELDICNEDAINQMVEKKCIDCIINCAAYTAVDKAETNQEICTKLNADAPGYLAKAINKKGGQIIHVSTDYVYGGSINVPYSEEWVTSPESIYGKTKLKGEKNVINNCSKYVILRTAWLYSPFGNNFVKTMIRLGKERDELGVVFDQVGTPTYALDLAKVIMIIIDKDIEPGIYNFSNEGVISWYDFAKAIHRIAGIKCDVRPIHTSDYPTPAKRPNYSVLDKTKIKKACKITIPYWEDSLQNCIEELNK